MRDIGGKVKVQVITKLDQNIDKVSDNRLFDFPIPVSPTVLTELLRQMSIPLCWKEKMASLSR